MRYLALACDYDGTLAHDGKVDRPTLSALERLRATGRRLLLVTGRELPELLKAFPQVDWFEWIVAENGALLYRPSAKEEKALAPPPLPVFVQRLRQRRVEPLAVGRVIVATWEPHQAAVLEVIRELGLELQVIFNKGAVMVLPAGINKASGLQAALKELGLSPHNVVGVGDAENDHAFLSLCECSAAVANALPMLKKTADVVLRSERGAGVVELIEQLLADDLAQWEDRLERHQLLLGSHDSTEVKIRPYDSNLLIAGPSGSGKSTAATAFLDRLAEQKYQFCIIDPEGDYEAYEQAVPLGTPQRGPSVEEVLQVLRNPETNASVNLVGLPLADRPPFFVTLLPRLQEMRARTGRPHWLIVDEAHHLMPASWLPASQALPQQLDCMVLITVHPDQVSPAVLELVDTVIAVGGEPGKTVANFCRVMGQEAPAGGPTDVDKGTVLYWSRRSGQPPIPVRVAPGHSEHRRHTRKYAEGALPPDQSFYFRGPQGKLNLRAQNLVLFTQLADGVDDETWLFHLRQGDYSRWFREIIKDDTLATETAAVEEAANLTAAESRHRIKEIIEKYYTLPASAPLPMPGTAAELGRAGSR